MKAGGLPDPTRISSDRQAEPLATKPVRSRESQTTAGKFDTYIQRITVCVSDCGEGDNFCSRLQARERTRVAILDQVIATDLRVYYEQRGDGTARFQR